MAFSPETATPMGELANLLLRSNEGLSMADRELIAIPGFPPSLADRATGCPFQPRCAFAVERCATDRPRMESVLPGREAACFESARIFEGATT